MQITLAFCIFLFGLFFTKTSSDLNIGIYLVVCSILIASLYLFCSSLLNLSPSTIASNLLIPIITSIVFTISEFEFSTGSFFETIFAYLFVSTTWVFFWVFIIAVAISISRFVINRS